MRFMQYMGLCVFSLPVSRMMIVRIDVFLSNGTNEMEELNRSPVTNVRSRSH